MSFLLYLLLVRGARMILDRLPFLPDEMKSFALTIRAALAITALLHMAAVGTMEKKLSV